MKIKNMKNFFTNEKGNILVMSAGAMVAMMIMASFAIDVGALFTAKNQLQCAVDAAALAGVSGLTQSQGEAVNRALAIGNRNTCVEQPIQLTAGDILFPTPTRIQVNGTHQVNLFFARAFGMNSSTVAATAQAELANLVGTPGTRPWILPDLGWPTGAPVMIKAGSIGVAPATLPSFYYPVCTPALNKGTPEVGGNVYKDKIMNGAEDEISIGDIMSVEPGNMTGPTKSGVRDLIAQDPNAYWDGSQVVNSDFPGNSSPRIMKLPLFDPDYPPYAGRKTVEVIGLAAFFLSGMQGTDVMGVFMYMITDGTPGTGYTFLQGIRLIQ